MTLAPEWSLEMIWPGFAEVAHLRICAPRARRRASSASPRLLCIAYTLCKAVCSKQFTADSLRGAEQAELQSPATLLTWTQGQESMRP